MTHYKYTGGKRFITFPPAGKPLNTVLRAARYIWSLIFLPYALLKAERLGTPGLDCRLTCIGLGLRAIAAGEMRRGLKLIADPMDSIRYFELSFVLETARRMSVHHYLDVSSPRLVPLMVASAHRGLVAEMINPLSADLTESAALSRSIGLERSCRLNCRTIEDADFPNETFDLITSVSVVEHIPEDSNAIATMWRMLRPGGKLVITVPCAREAFDEHTNCDEYGLVEPDHAGYVFWQRYYSERSLRERIWSITGEPTTIQLYGESVRGIYDRSVEEKRTNRHYQFWKEPILMGQSFRKFCRFEELVGFGVVAMVFSKPVKD